MSKRVPARSDCAFFHVIDLPGENPTEGSWDFRRTEAEYHGGYDFAGKSVLEIGSATGAHAFWMESQGAAVTPYDLSPDFNWDVMPTYDQDEHEVRELARSGTVRLNNGWWYCRHRLGSSLELTHGSIYDIPPTLGDFDVVTFGSVLLHCRDPIGALLHGADRAKDTVIVTDRLPVHFPLDKPYMEFIPKMGLKKNWGGWTYWWISPRVLSNLLALRGFSKFDLQVSKHLFVPTQNRIDLFTLVASRSDR